MASDSARLSRLLAELRSQLALSKSLDTADRSRLETTLDDVERALGETAAKGPRTETLAARLGESAAGFEASHPTLATTLEGLIDALGNLGI